MSYHDILYEEAGGIATLTLNRPDAFRVGGGCLLAQRLVNGSTLAYGMIRHGIRREQ